MQRRRKKADDSLEKKSQDSQKNTFDPPSSDDDIGRHMKVSVFQIRLVKIYICFAYTINVKMAHLMLEFKAIGKSDTSYFWLQSPKWPVCVGRSHRSW